MSRSESGTDEYGNRTDIETSRSILCYLEPFARTGQIEGNVDRSTTSDDYALYVKAGTALTPVDAITVDGEDGTFEVIGEPTNVWNPRTAEVSHREVRVRRTTR